MLGTAIPLGKALNIPVRQCLRVSSFSKVNYFRVLSDDLIIIDKPPLLEWRMEYLSFFYIYSVGEKTNSSRPLQKVHSYLWIALFKKHVCSFNKLP